MRISQSQLRQIIKEELESLTSRRGQLNPEQIEIIMQAREQFDQSFANALADMMRTNNARKASSIADALYLSGLSSSKLNLYLAAANASNSSIGKRVMTPDTHDEYGNAWGSHPYHYPPGQESRWRY